MLFTAVPVLRIKRAVVAIRKGACVVRHFVAASQVAYSRGLMKYLKLKRTRLILACFALPSFLLLEFPGIDIGVSRAFFDNGFYMETQWWERLFQNGLGYFLCASFIAVVGLYAFNSIAKRNLLGVDGRTVLYLVMVLILGAGLIVNVIFKDHFGRARPRDIEEFGGAKHFTPAFVISRECDSNCSFSSGHGAGGFFALALAFALSRKRAVHFAGAGFGGVVSFSRIAAGAHFLSDSMVSLFVMLIVSDVLYFYLIEQPIGHATTGEFVAPSQ